MIGSLFKRKYSPEEVAIHLAELALKIDDEREELIQAAAEHCGVDVARLRKEFLHLQAYCIDTAIQSLGRPVAPELEKQFWRYVSIATKDLPGGKFLADQAKRTERYDDGWIDFAQRDDSTAMPKIFADACGVTEDWLPLIPLWLRCASLMTELTKFLRSQRIAVGS